MWKRLISEEQQRAQGAILNINKNESLMIYAGFWDASDIDQAAEQIGYKELTDEEIKEIIYTMHQKFDANVGVNWDYIKDCIREVKE